MMMMMMMMTTRWRRRSGHVPRRRVASIWPSECTCACRTRWNSVLCNTASRHSGTSNSSFHCPYTSIDEYFHQRHYIIII